MKEKIKKREDPKNVLIESSPIKTFGRELLVKTTLSGLCNAGYHGKGKVMVTLANLFKGL